MYLYVKCTYYIWHKYITPLTLCHWGAYTPFEMWFSPALSMLAIHYEPFNSVLVLPPCYLIQWVTYYGGAVSLPAQGVLVDVYDAPVLQQGLGARTQAPQVVGHEQRRGHQSPQCHLGLLLVVTQTKVPNHQLLDRGSGMGSWCIVTFKMTLKRGAVKY